MNDEARNAAPIPSRSSLSKHTESQLDLDLGDVHLPPGPDWESLPEASRAETVTVLARLLAKAGAAEEESDV